MSPSPLRKLKSLANMLRPVPANASEKDFWQGAAQKNPMWAIATSRKDWTTDEFLNDGAWRVAKWVTPWLYQSGFDRARGRFLEIGCGAGRFAYHIAPQVGAYVGVDIVPQHLEMARDNCRERTNATFVEVDGSNLAPIDSSSVDAVFSYAVFQHIYSKERILSYVDETLRVLRPGGTAKFQLIGENCTPGLHLRWHRLADEQAASPLARLASTLLPADVLVPSLSFYKAGVGMRGMGIPSTELLAYVTGKCASAHVEDFEDLNRANCYWLVLTR